MKNGCISISMITLLYYFITLIVYKSYSPNISIYQDIYIYISHIYHISLISFFSYYYEYHIYKIYIHTYNIEYILYMCYTLSSIVKELPSTKPLCNYSFHFFHFFHSFFLSVSVLFSHITFYKKDTIILLISNNSTLSDLVAVTILPKAVNL